MLALGCPLVALGCEDGGGDDRTNVAPDGAYQATLTLDGTSCAGSFSEPIGCDLYFEDMPPGPGDIFQIVLYVPETEGCFYYIWTIDGLMTSATTGSVNEGFTDYVCQLDEFYGWDSFQLTGCDVTFSGGYASFDLVGNILNDPGCDECLGGITLSGSRR